MLLLLHLKRVKGLLVLLHLWYVFCSFLSNHQAYCYLTILSVNFPKQGERKEPRRTGQGAGNGRDFSNPSDVLNQRPPTPSSHPLHPISKKTFKPKEEKDIWKRKAPTPLAVKAQSSDPFMQKEARPEDNTTTQRGRPRQRESNGNTRSY
jgi:hypothetical protein